MRHEHVLLKVDSDIGGESVMGFDIRVTQEYACPHCGGTVSSRGRGEELYYAGRGFFKGGELRIGAMQEHWNMHPENGQGWSCFSANGEEAIAMLQKIEHVVEPKEYRRIIAALSQPHTSMFGSW
jgi:hypothetical protein